MTLTKATLYDPFQRLKVTIDQNNQISSVTGYLSSGPGGKGEISTIAIIANGTTYKLAPDFNIGRGIGEGI